MPAISMIMKQYPAIRRNRSAHRHASEDMNALGAKMQTELFLADGTKKNLLLIMTKDVDINKC